MRVFKIQEELITGIIYSQFDEKYGPIAIAWLPPDLPLSIKDYISFKSMNILAGEDGAVPQSLAIIPFPSKNLKGLIKSLEIKDKARRGGVIDSSITLIFNAANDLLFYRNIHDVEHLFNEAATRIIDLVESKARRSEIESALKEFYDKITSTFITSLQQKERPKESERSLILLFNLVSKDLDKVINELILGKTVIVTGDKPLVELIINTLRLFCTVQDPKIVYWAEEYTSGHLIGGPSYLTEIFKNEVILHLKEGKVFDGKSNSFCKKLLKNARKLDSDHAEQVIKKELQTLIEGEKLCYDIVTQKVDESQIEDLISKLDVDQMDLIETITKLKHPELEEKITETATLCRTKLSKIMSGFEKHKW